MRPLERKSWRLLKDKSWRPLKYECPGKGENRFSDNTGIALLLVLLALSLLSLLGLFMMFEGTTGLHISDNYESRVRATYAALAGLNHAHVLMRGLDNDISLLGPDGDYSRNPAYLKQAKEFGFRNPLPLSTASSLNISDPEGEIPGDPEDGLMNTGFYNGTEGTLLIPGMGIARNIPNPNVKGENVVSRYFVKVTDNNGDASEIKGDPTDNPFVDGDGVVIVRSMGIARTFSDTVGLIQRMNSVVVFEARYRKFSLFDLGPALLVLGSRILPAFKGNYEIDGNSCPGIGVIDTDVADPVSPQQTIATGRLGGGKISGAGLPNPSIQDFTVLAESDPAHSLILNPQYLWDFVFNRIPPVSDHFFQGDQSWDPWNAPDIGFYDSTQPLSAPKQDPKITVVHGDLRMTGALAGGGLLIVTGNFECLNRCQYNGLVLVIGSGRAVIDTTGKGITGGLVVANLDEDNGNYDFRIPGFSIMGDSRITSDRSAVRMALSLIPSIQTGFREIAGTDPRVE